MAEADSAGAGALEPALGDLRVIDLSSWIAGGYCTKLLADAGAEVIKVESPEGDPLRRWSASASPIPEGGDGALFNYLAASKRSVVLDPAGFGSIDQLDQLLATADAVVWSSESPWAGEAGLAPRLIQERHPHLLVATISPFGLEGSWSGTATTEFCLQAWSGAIIGLARGRPDRDPVYVGGQVGEWLAGLWTAIGLLAARRRSAPAGELIDVSVLEALAVCLTYYPVTFNDQLGRPMRRRRFVPTPGVGAARDGLVGLGCGTGQQWLDFCVMVGHPEWMEDPKLFLDRAGLAPDIDAWIAERSVDEVLETASSFRIPNAPIGDGSNLASFDHMLAREAFVPNPRDDAPNPQPPYRLGPGRLRPPSPAPKIGEASLAEILGRLRPERRPSAPRESSLPFEGLRILDMTAYWAGPLATHVLAMLGAEVIHVEAPGRPDGVRLVGGVPQTEDQYWERGPIFAALNTNKKSLTLDLTDPKGADLLRRFVSSCDAVVENYTPRVLEQLGLDYESLRVHRPDLVMVRMPGFGLDGPWRDRAAFAFVIEDASGFTWLTGHPDLLPYEPYCIGDSNAGLHAALGLLVALAHRDRTGEGSLVEASMLDAALNVTAEQPIEFAAYGALLSRQGNRGPLAAPQNLYQTATADGSGRGRVWAALAVATDDQWEALRKVLGEPEWASSRELDTAAGRRARQDLIDSHLGEWFAELEVDRAVEVLRAAGVPVARVMDPHHQPDLPPFADRGFFEKFGHPVAGTARYSTVPMRLSGGPDRFHRRHAPLLGEHTRGLLTEVGLSSGELDSLEADGVIGCSLRAVT